MAKVKKAAKIKKVAKKVVKKVAKKAAKKVVKKVASKTPEQPRILTDSNGDPIGGTVVRNEVEATETSKTTEISTKGGAVSIKAKKTASDDTGGKKGYSVVMRGGVPTKVEDNGDEAI